MHGISLRRIAIFAAVTAFGLSAGVLFLVFAAF